MLNTCRLIWYDESMKIKTFLYFSIFVSLIVLVILAFSTGESMSYSQVLRVRDGKIITFNEMLKELQGIDIVFIGELHDNRKHHKAQLDVIKAIGELDISLAVGLEMFKAEDQEELDLWLGERLALESFIKTYYDYWRLPWTFYENIFVYSKAKGIPLVGLNVPREISRKVLEHGFQSLNSEDLANLPPDISCDDIDEAYMGFIKEAYNEHDWEGKDFTYFCEAQMVWDKSMAWYLLGYMKEKPARTIVVLSGIGHSWKRGIPEQVARQSDYSFKVILPAVAGQVKGDTITKDDADYLLLK